MVLNFKPLEGTEYHELTKAQVDRVKSIDGKKRILTALVAEGHSEYIDDLIKTSSELTLIFDNLRDEFSIADNKNMMVDYGSDKLVIKDRTVT